MKVPQRLMKQLPFKSKAKVTEALRTEKEKKQRPAVIRSAADKEVAALIQRLNIVKKDKMQKRQEAKERKREAKQKQGAFIQAKRDLHTKENRKRKLALDGKKDAAKRKKMGM